MHARSVADVSQCFHKIGETFVKRQKQGNGLEAQHTGDCEKPSIQATVKRESIFSKKLARDAGGRTRARDGAPRLCISLSHLRISLSQQRDSCSCAWEQLIHVKVVPLSEKSYHFWKSPTTFPPLQLSHRWLQLSHHWLQLSRKREQLSYTSPSLSSRPSLS